MERVFTGELARASDSHSGHVKAGSRGVCHDVWGYRGDVAM